jgi:hypothetical protein
MEVDMGEWMAYGIGVGRGRDMGWILRDDL